MTRLIIFLVQEIVAVLGVAWLVQNTRRLKLLPHVMAETAEGRFSEFHAPLFWGLLCMGISFGIALMAVNVGLLDTQLLPYLGIGVIVSQLPFLDKRPTKTTKYEIGMIIGFLIQGTYLAVHMMNVASILSAAG